MNKWNKRGGSRSEMNLSSIHFYTIHSGPKRGCELMKGKVLRRGVWASDQQCLLNPIGSSLVKIYYPRNHSDNTTHTLITLGLANVNGPHHRTIRRRPRRRTRTTRQGLLKVLLWFVNLWKTNNRTLGSKWRVMFNLGPLHNLHHVPSISRSLVPTTDRMMSIRFLLSRALAANIRSMTDQLSFTLPIGHYLDKKCQSVKPTDRRVSFV